MDLDFKSGSALGKRIGCCGFFGDLAPQGRSAAAAGPRPPEHNRRGDKDGGVSADNYANNDGEREIPQHRAAKEKQAKNRDKRHRACKNRATQRLVDARVHNFLDGPPPSAGETFPDPVVNDNRIINGIAGDGQHGANHRESKFAPEKREHADGHEYVVQQGDNGPHGKRKLEAKRHENQDAEDAQAERY